MRVELIKCDTCKKEHDVQYVLPPEWVTTIQKNGYGRDDKEKHFCSKTCLIAWATQEESNA